MLALELSQKDCETLHEDALAGEELAVDLEQNQTIRPNQQSPIKFEIDPFRRHCLLNGLDDIGFSFQHRDLIDQFERRRKIIWPWLDGVGRKREAKGKIVAVPVERGVKNTDW